MVAAVVFLAATLLAALVTVLLAASAVGQHRRAAKRHRVRRTGVEVPATVVGNQTRPLGRRQVGFAPVVRYVTLTGVEVTAAALDVLPERLPIGHSSNIAYDSQEPESVTLLHEGTRTGAVFVTTLAIGMAMATVVTGFFAARLVNQSRTVPFDLPGVDVPGVSIHK